jgi:hypothetical protein
MGKIIGASLDGSIRRYPIIYKNNSSAVNFIAENTAIFKKNGIIYTKAATVGTNIYRKFDFDKTFYYAFVKDTPLTEVSNINLIRSICLALANGMELAFGTSGLNQIDLVIESVMEPYIRYISSYTYTYGTEQNTQTFQKSYYIEVNLFIDGILTQLHLGYTL